jgi:hypothetical protein
MGDSLDQEVHGGEFGPAEFALPVLYISTVLSVFVAVRLPSTSLRNEPPPVGGLIGNEHAIKSRRGPAGRRAIEKSHRTNSGWRIAQQRVAPIALK